MLKKVLEALVIHPLARNTDLNSPEITISDVKSFLTDASRSIKPGGAVIMIEPWVTKWSRFVYSYLHHEPFDPEIKEWILPKGRPLSSANPALPWIVFERDREKFKDEFPK